MSESRAPSREHGQQEPIDIPTDREDPFHPPQEYTRLRAENPVVRARLLHGGPEVWLVTRHQDVKSVLQDTRFSSDVRRPGFPLKRTPSALIRMDPPEHTRYRKMLHHEFVGRRIAELRPAVEELTGRLLDRIVEGPNPVDLVPALAMPLPSLVICRLLGVPDKDSAFLQECTTTALRPTATPAEVDQAVADLGGYMDAVVRDKLLDPGDDLLSRLVVDQVRAGHCAEDTAADLGRLMFVAGHVTTVHMIGLGILTLLRHPNQLREMRADPTLIAPAVNELLRHLTVVRTLARVATLDVEVGGVVICAGEGVVASLSSANRDERWFADPDRFDIHRVDGSHLAFGYGPHLCLGATLARLELRVVLSQVFRRLPNLRLAGEIQDIPFRDRMTFYGLNRLPVIWDPA